MANNHTSLAVKYRPQSFEDVCGQDTVKHILKHQIDTNSFKQGYLFCGRFGSGKALPLDSDILGPDGYFKMRDAKVGMKVWGEDGKLHNIVGVYPQGVKEMYRIHFSDNTYADCCIDHLWTMRLRGCEVTDGPHSWFTHSVRWLLKQDLWDETTTDKYGSRGKSRRFMIPVVEPLHMEERYLPIDSYLVGQFIAGGDISEAANSISDDLRKLFADGRIPKEYLFSSIEQRTRLLQGLFDSCGNIRGNHYTYSTSREELYNDIRFLVQSLGGVADVCEESTPSDNDHSSTCREFTFHLPANIIPFTTDYLKKQYDDLDMINDTCIYKFIDHIEKLPDMECQCIMTDNPTGLFLINDCIVTHNTTCARIFAKTINNGPHDIIEIDAATYNSVEQIRVISDEARKKPLVGKYKIFIIDECFRGDTQVLTSTGFKRFDELDETELIAQYDDDGTISFVKPNRYIKRWHEGDIVKFTPYGGHSFYMTPNHMQPIKCSDNSVINSSIASYPEDIIKSGSVIRSGLKYDKDKIHLSILDKLVIATVAGKSSVYEVGSTSEPTTWKFTSSYKGAIERLSELLELSGCNYIIKTIPDESAYFLYYSLPIEFSGRYKDHFKDLNVDSSYGRLLIEEMMYWNNSVTDADTSYVQFDDTDNFDFICSICAISGISYNCATLPGEFGDLYPTFNIVNSDLTPCCGMEREFEHYSGFVYCVEVPSHKIIVRSDSGFTMISGNCHMMSQAANNAFLKILEEPPATAMFILATTDPQKLLSTILSRVQRYDFTNIPTEEIVNRLKYIADKENINIDEPSIRYIAKQAEGGMRDAISALDKCNSVSDVITLDKVASALSSVGYGEHLDLLAALTNKDTKSAIQIVNDAYESGKDMKKFMNQFMWCTCDVCNFFVFNSFDYINIPDLPEYRSKMSVLDMNSCLGILTWSKELNYRIRQDISPKNAILVEVMLLCSR